MASNKKLSLAEIYYIESHMDTKSTQEISRDIGTTVSNVEKVIESIKTSKPNKTKKETATQKAFKQNKQPGSVAEKYGVTIMSQTASELGDSSKGGKKVGRDDCIHKPRD